MYMLWANEFLFWVFNFVLGTIVGSFLNVVIYRLPKGESVVYPASHCPVCNHPLKWYDMIPILSYIVLRGRCRYCGSKISVRYPIIEAITGLAFVGIGLRYGWSLKFFEYITFSSLLIATGFTDIFDGVVPDIIVIPGAAIGLIFSLVQGKTMFLNSLYGLILMGGFFALIILITRGGMGQGDVTLGLMIGAFLGLEFSIITLVLSFIIGGIGGAVAVIFMRKKGKDTMPFGPFLAISAYIAIMYGYVILHFYMKFFTF